MDEHEHNKPPVAPYDTTVAPEEVTNNANTTPATNSTVSKSNKGLFIGVAIIVAAVAGFAAYHFWPQGADEGNGAAVGASTTGPVATVNGEPIPRDLFNENVARLTEQATQQGVDASSPEVQTEISSQVVESLINTELLLQGAETVGVAPTEAEIDEELTNIEEQFGGAEALQTQMETLGLTEAELRGDISEQLAVNQYLMSQVAIEEVEVTDAEVQEFYDTVAAQNPDQVPPLPDVREQIVAELRAQKEQTLIQEFIASLRAEADVEVLI